MCVGVEYGGKEQRGGRGYGLRGGERDSGNRLDAITTDTLQLSGKRFETLACLFPPLGWSIWQLEVVPFILALMISVKR